MTMPQLPEGVGVMYLIDFEPAYVSPNGRATAKHYLGFASSLEAAQGAIARTLTGSTRSKLPRVAVAAGCKLRVVRTWSGTYEDYRRLKATHSLPKYCPLCQTLRKLKRQDSELGELLARSMEIAATKGAGALMIAARKVAARLVRTRAETRKRRKRTVSARPRKAKEVPNAQAD